MNGFSNTLFIGSQHTYTVSKINGSPVRVQTHKAYWQFETVTESSGNLLGNVVMTALSAFNMHNCHCWNQKMNPWLVLWTRLAETLYRYQWMKAFNSAKGIYCNNETGFGGVKSPTPGLTFSTWRSDELLRIFRKQKGGISNTAGLKSSTSEENHELIMAAKKKKQQKTGKDDDPVVLCHRYREVPLTEVNYLFSVVQNEAIFF